MTTVIYRKALTDAQAIAELGPTECGRRCGRLLSASEPWVVHDGRVEHVDCHEQEGAMDVEAELDTIASGSETERTREAARQAVLAEVARLQAIEQQLDVTSDQLAVAMLEAGWTPPTVPGSEHRGDDMSAPDAVEVDEADLEVTVRRAHHPCGMHVDAGSYVEVTHTPTGCTVAVKTGRAQMVDKRLALVALRAVLASDEMQVRHRQRKAPTAVETS